MSKLIRMKTIINTLNKERLKMIDEEANKIGYDAMISISETGDPVYTFVPQATVEKETYAASSLEEAYRCLLNLATTHVETGEEDADNTDVTLEMLQKASEEEGEDAKEAKEEDKET